MKFNVAIIILTLVSIAYAQSAPEGMGFYSDATSSIPLSVQKASKSVFRLVVPAGNKVTVANLFNGKTTEEAINFINGLDKSKISKTDKLIFLYQLHECLKNPSQVCTLFEGVDQGTGFVVDNGRKIYTAYHVIKSVASSQPLPVFIIGPNEEVIFSPDQIALTISSVGNSKVPRNLNPNIESKLGGSPKIL